MELSKHVNLNAVLCNVCENNVSVAYYSIESKRALFSQCARNHKKSHSNQKQQYGHTNLISSLSGIPVQNNRFRKK